MINENSLAVEISKREKGAVEVPVGQIKEILSITLRLLATKYKRSEVMVLLENRK